MQREQQDKLMDEMFSPIGGQVLPASIEERLDMYKQRNKLEDEGKKYKILKEKFLNYRQFNFKLIKGKKEVIPAYALFYSALPRKRAQGRVEFSHNNIHYFNREEIKFITLEYFNSCMKTSYKTINDLIFNPLHVEQELELRKIINSIDYGLSPIIIVEKIIDTKLTIELSASTYEDVKEKLIKL